MNALNLATANASQLNWARRFIRGCAPIRAAQPTAGPAFQQEIAACLGREFDLDSARAPFIELSNGCITATGTLEAVLVLGKLLCR